MIKYKLSIFKNLYNKLINKSLYLCKPILPNFLKLSIVNGLDTNKITFFSHNKEFNVTDKQYHCLSQIRNIQGTSFLLPSHLIDLLLNLVVETVDECIESGYIGSDEKIFDICYTKQTHLFTLIKSDWREYFDLLL